MGEKNLCLTLANEGYGTKTHPRRRFALAVNHLRGNKEGCLLHLYDPSKMHQPAPPSENRCPSSKESPNSAAKETIANPMMFHGEE
jgi:hypothetical protein